MLTMLTTWKLACHKNYLLIVSTLMLTACGNNATGTIAPFNGSLSLSLGKTSAYLNGESVLATATLVGANKSINNLTVSFATSPSTVVTTTPSTCTIASAQAPNNSCSVNLSGFTESANVSVIATASGYSPAATTITILPAMLLLANGTNSIERCVIAEANSIGLSCTSLTVSQVTHVDQITMESSNTIAYILDNESDTVFKCDYDSGVDDSINNCKPYYNGNNVLQSIAIDTVSDSMYLTLSTGSTITQCSLNESAPINACPFYQNESFDNVTTLALNHGATELYSVNQGDIATTINQCNLVQDVLSHCSVYAQTPPDNQQGSGFEQIAGMVSNSNNSVLYVTDAESNNHLWLCSLDIFSGVITACTPYDNSLFTYDYPQGIALNKNNSQLYIAVSTGNSDGGFIANCHLTESGTVTSCESSSVSMVNPFAITLVD